MKIVSKGRYTVLGVLENEYNGKPFYKLSVASLTGDSCGQLKCKSDVADFVKSDKFKQFNPYDLVINIDSDSSDIRVVSIV